MQKLSLYQQAIVAGSRVFRLLDETELAPEQMDEKQVMITEGRVEFRNISFSYDGKRDVLKNISFTANSGRNRCTCRSYRKREKLDY